MEKYALTVDIDSNYYPKFYFDEYFYEKQVNRLSYLVKA
jgi:hypothetical protein